MSDFQTASINVDKKALARVLGAESAGFTDLVEKFAELNPEENLKFIALNNVTIRSKENLSGYDFTGSSLKGATLSGVDLRSSKLNYADLTGSDLKKANLSGLDLRTTVLEYADLSGADLRGALFDIEQIESAKKEGILLGDLPEHQKIVDMSPRESLVEKIEAEEITPTITQLLRAADDGDIPIPDHSKDPATAFRYLYDAWVRRGSYSRGKPRHSVRQIKQWLGGDHQVRSLETKLAGKTWLKYEDALALMKVFLSRWTFMRDGEYKPYKEGDIENLSREFLDELFPVGEKALLLPERTRRSAQVGTHTTLEGLTSPATTQQLVDSTKATMPSGETIMELFTHSETLVTMSNGREIIDNDPARSIADFNNLMHALKDIDIADGRERMVVWIIDIGLREKSNSSLYKMYVMQAIASQFRSIGLIEDKEQKDLLNWLRNNVCIIAGPLTKEETDQVYRLSEFKLKDRASDSTWFHADRLFLDSVPTNWLDSPGSEVFGKRQRELWQYPTITAHFRIDGWDSDDPQNTEQNLRYLFHGEAAYPASDNSRESHLRCINLPDPGERWSAAYRLAVHAARGRLNKPSDHVQSAIETTEAISLLRKNNLAVLRLNEFLQLSDILIGLNG